MKKALVLSALLGLFIAPASQAATLNLSGTIALSCTLNSVTAVAAATTLPIAAGGNNIVVGTTSVSCNDADGYTISASSANAGKLINGSAPNNQVSYTLEILGAGSTGVKTLTNSAQTMVSHTSLSAPLVNNSRNIEVDVTAASVAWAGTYSDTVTVTFAAL